MVIAKKNVARAVDRNRIKRQIREAFRKIQNVDDSALDIVVLARPAILSEASLEEVIQYSFGVAQTGAIDNPKGKNH